MPKSLHNRYKRLQDEAFNQGKEVSQRSWLVALLAEGPRSPSQLRDMVERCSAQAQKEHGGPDSVVGALVPTELTRQYRSWIHYFDGGSSGVPDARRPANQQSASGANRTTGAGRLVRLVRLAGPAPHCSFKLSG